MRCASCGESGEGNFCAQCGQPLGEARQLWVDAEVVEVVPAPHLPPRVPPAAAESTARQLPMASELPGPGEAALVRSLAPPTRALAARPGEAVEALLIESPPVASQPGRAGEVERALAPLRPMNEQLAGRPPAYEPSEDAGPEWHREHRYELLLNVPTVRATIERHAARATKKITGEEFLALCDKAIPMGVPLEKVVLLVQPLYEKLGFATGKEHVAEIPAAIGRVMLRLLCALARHGRTLQGLHQGTDGCVFDAVLPSDLLSMRGSLMVSLRAVGPALTRVEAATKIPGQLYDWGKSARCLAELFQDLAQDPVG